MIHRHASTVSQRVQWVSQVIAASGSYGMISQMSRRHGVSRQTLYSWKVKGSSGWQAALEPRQPVTKKTVQMERAVLTLLLQGHASYRGIQACLKELPGMEVSLGTLSTIVQAAGERAQRWVEQQVCVQGRVLALDEQYSSKRGEALSQYR